MGQLERADVPSMMSDFQFADGIVFDIRNYPKGTLWSLVPYLFDSLIHIASFTNPDVRYPGTMNWQPEVIGDRSPTRFYGKIAILFDERTQSQAEYTVMGLEQYPGAIKIGSTTSAADGNVAYMYLPGQLRALATFLGTFYPDHTPTQRVGIIPDIYLRPTIQGIRNGEDELLDRALKELACASTTGLITSESENGGVSIYPNPAYNKLVLNHTELDVQFSELSVYDQYGRLVLQDKIEAAEHIIDISSFTSGSYMIKLGSGLNISNLRFIKM
jgi:C-terminal processing protease CtpA/Prc